MADPRFVIDMSVPRQSEKELIDFYMQCQVVFHMEGKMKLRGSFVVRGVGKPPTSPRLPSKLHHQLP